MDCLQIDAKPSVPQGEGIKPRSKKIFVGGLAGELTEGVSIIMKWSIEVSSIQINVSSHILLLYQINSRSTSAASGWWSMLTS